MGSVLEYIAASRRKVDAGKFSVVGFCNDAVAGLVAITPAAGYVPYWSAPIFGIAGSFFVALFQDTSEAYFDTNEIFVVHGVAGWVGMLLTAGLARADVAALDEYTVIVNHKWEQLGIQVSDGLAGMAWSGGITFLILLCMEAVTIFTRRLWGIPEPEFQLILDQDIILDHEIGDECAAKTKESNDMALVRVNSYREGETILPGAGELEAGTFVGRSSRRDALRSRTRRFL
ncbi:hypothetical protein IFR04_000765 [Cadophora malorum]|uniref:Ammonium transporter AmtB-like domain-containing protein n=1 Tax=Cadophora malorum TaxID=108018 RepID=A0A8H7WJA5_9HELO|nr:hypothetical protein IFR04_000765 [Cadophora malorum]